MRRRDRPTRGQAFRSRRQTAGSRASRRCPRARRGGSGAARARDSARSSASSRRASPSARVLGTDPRRAVALHARPRVVDEQLDQVDAERTSSTQLLGVDSRRSGTVDRTAGLFQPSSSASSSSAVSPLVRPRPTGAAGSRGASRGRHVGELGRDQEVRVAEGQHGVGQAPGRIVEHVRAQRGAEIEVGVGLETPRDGGAVGEPGLADRPVLEVPQVAPVGVEVAGAAVRERRGGRVPAGADACWSTGPGCSASSRSPAPPRTARPASASTAQRSSKGYQSS